MWTFFFLALSAALALVLLLLQRRHAREVEDLKLKIAKVEEEEHRVFDFLHGLGEAFSDEVKPGELYRLIVEASVRILDVHGGALYLVDRPGSRLMPAYLSPGCPPLIPVPEHVAEQATTTPVALESYLKLHPVARGDGLLGQIWDSGTPVFIRGDQPDDRLAELCHPSLRIDGLLAAPLVYGTHHLGVLAAVNGPMSEPFENTDIEVFKAIAEQSAFALYNAVIYSEAGEKRRLDCDLQTAREIQSILLPSGPPRVPGFEVGGTTLPARHVSGDYFDYIRVDEDRLGIVIADVSGKGVPASLLMAMARVVIRSHAEGNPSASSVLGKVNRQLYPDIREDMFISMLYVVLNHKTGAINLARAGHNPPLLYAHNDQSVVRLNPRGMALGIDSGETFERVTVDFSVNLEKDDCLVLYTDGMTEAVDGKGMEFGMERMIQSVQASATQGAGNIVARLTDELRGFVGNQPQYDDVTLIAIRKL